jgi:hypothetical protein
MFARLHVSKLTAASFITIVGTLLQTIAHLIIGNALAVVALGFTRCITFICQNQERERELSIKPMHKGLAKVANLWGLTGPRG